MERQTIVWRDLFPLTGNGKDDLNNCGNNDWLIEELIKDLRKKDGFKFVINQIRISKTRIYFFLGEERG
jgi:hypothetical protein